MSRRKPKTKKRKGPGHTPLLQHKKVGSKLSTAMSGFNVELMDWARDLLPEHLWIASLAEEYGLSRFHNLYNKFLDELDKIWEKDDVLLGLITDFGLIPRDKRDKFIKDNEELISTLFHKPIGRILAFYPENPAAWLITEKHLSESGRLDPDVELPRLRSLVIKMLPGKNEFAGRIRAIPMNRLLKHNKIFFNKDLSVVELMPKYPTECTEGERFLVESTARSGIHIGLQQRKEYLDKQWSKYFWRHNFDLVACKVHEYKLQGAKSISPEQGEQLRVVIEHNFENVQGYLSLIAQKWRPDIYDPARDEILFGLFSRTTRIHSLMLQDPLMWARDVSGIMLRCLADTAITFAYLVKCGTNGDFQKFIEHGKGQQKLLMLQLQDRYPDELSLEGNSAEQISEELGGFSAELIDIELGHWTKKDTRRLATDAGLEKLYRLVYTPTSSELHGSWLSLEKSNLSVCSEPLHRFHRLPSSIEPPLIINALVTALELYEFCRGLAVDKLSYPKPSENQKPYEFDI